LDTLTFQSLKKNTKKDFSSFPKVRTAVLADSAIQMYVTSLKGLGYEAKTDFEIFEADYNQIERQIYDPNSELYQFNPEFVIIFYCTNKLLKRFGTLQISEKWNFAQKTIAEFQNLFDNLSNNLKCKIICFNFNEIIDNVFGNFSNKTPYSFNYQLRKINFELMNLSQQLKNLYILDLKMLQSQFGSNALSDHKIYANTDLFFSLDFLPLIAKNTADIILSVKGIMKKCLILDLDNTLWGGVIGDDGIENIQLGELGIGKIYSEIQLWAKQLQQRGIILAVCSKNDPEIAKEPFEKHPDMILRLEDISVFISNWNNKAENIRRIRDILNIGFDSMVFLDDNIFERNMVRMNIPEITIPELPEDPADYLNFISELNLFETSSFTNEDIQRTEQYHSEAKRETERYSFINEEDFLKSLEMKAIIEPFNEFNTPRVAQLIQRSNQFNLRTIRYTEQDIYRIGHDPGFITMAVTLHDKFGNLGLISLIILKKMPDQSLFIDTWIMSCRVLKRNVEIFVLNAIVGKAKEQKYPILRGEYLPSAKNAMVKDHYQNLGFEKRENYWELPIEKHRYQECYIQN
jgi:FkbH-like protein